MESPRMPEDVRTTPSHGTVFGTLLCRVIIPLWVLAGAAFKLYERNPGNLPSGVRDLFKKTLGVQDLDTLLRVLIGCELFAVGVMLLLPRFARPMAIFMLVCFCLILTYEIATGAATCGCFGKLPMKPWQMLAIDGSLLALVVMFPNRSRSGLSFAGSLVSAAAIAVVGMGIAIAVPKPPDIQQTPIAHDETALLGGATTQPGTESNSPSNAPADAPPNATQPSVPAPPTTTAPAQPTTPPATVPSNLPPTVNPNPKALPASWYTQDMDKWIGKPWRELEIFQLMPKWPRDMDKGPRYIIFYSRTCEHCRDMLDMELINPLDGLITLVEVPASRTEMTDPNGWPMPMSVEMVLEAELLQLPLGPNWIVTTPMIIKVVDGKVVCATEGDNHKKCLGLP